MEGADLYSGNIDDVLTQLGASAEGLTGDQARERLQKYGANRLPDPEIREWPQILLAQLKNPLVIILAAASVISIFLGENVDAVVIIVILGINTILGFYQEYRSEQAVRELRKFVTHHVNAMRDGAQVSLDASELVPGDVVLLGIGDVVPADLRLLGAGELSVDESVLTGESQPVEKDPDAFISDTSPDISDLVNCAFMGTTVESGNANGLVVSTGINTYFARTAKLLSAKVPATDFETGIRRFGNLLMVIIVIMTVFVFVANALLHHGVVLSLLFALALAVGITPEAMPIIITISLSRGALRLAKEEVVVKRLAAIENLGNMDILCSDKTGTLTKNQITLRSYFNAREQEDDKVLELAWLCNSATINRGKVEGNNIDAAIIRFCQESGKSFSGYRKIETVEFDFKRRRMSVVVEKDGQPSLICKGAPESVLAVCSVLDDGKPLDAGEQDRLSSIIDKQGQEGLRSVAVARRDIAKKDDYTAEDEREMIFCGIITLEDPPKEDAGKALARLGSMEVDFKLLSGDDPLVSINVCRAVGLDIQEERVITGKELEGADEKKLADLIDRHDIFARVNPEQKFSIIMALRKAGHVVGYIGDGVNDAPSLRAADVGVSVDTAVDVAKDAADIILLRPGLEVLAAGIRSGREVFMNITKYLLNTMSANYGNMLTVALASIFLKFIPLLPSQILLNNFLTDIPMITISTDNVDEVMLHKPRRWDLKLITKFMIAFGLISTAFDFVTISILIYGISASPELFRTGWFLESAFSEILITFAIRTALPFYRSRPSNTLMWVSAAAFFAGILIVYTPFGHLFEFVFMPLWFFATIIGIIVVYFIIAEIAKRILYPRLGLSG
jgi:P-type Mg2+ transporter